MLFHQHQEVLGHILTHYRRYIFRQDFTVMKIIHLVVLFQIYRVSLGSDILAVFPYQGGSHQLFFQAVLSSLLEDGHTITCVSPVPLETNHTNYTHLLIPLTPTSWRDLFEYEESANMSPSEGRYILHILSDNFLKTLFTSEVFQNFISKEDKKYDLIIIEPFFVQESMIFLSHRFNAPVAAIGTCFPYAAEDLYSGSGRNPAIVPQFETFSPGKMDFKTRVLNILNWLDNVIQFKYYYLPKKEEMLRKYISYPGIENLPPLSELLSSISLYLINSNSLISPIRPVSSNVISIPGLHIIQQPVLPKEYQVLMDNAKEGVVLFTLGSMIPVSKMSTELKNAFVRAFGRIKHLILWKTDEFIKGLPPNVKMENWLPQQAILSHKNCKLLITHGGMMSKQEAIYFGVPMVMIPLFGDQPMNAAHSQEKGLGLAILYKNLTEHTIFNTISSVLNQERFQVNAKLSSSVFQDQVKESSKNLKYWVNHVIKFKGADYMKTVPLNWVQYYSIDVILFFFIVTVVFIFGLYKFTSFICSYYDKKRTFATKKRN